MKKLLKVVKWMFFQILLVGFPAYTVFQETGWFNFDNGYTIVAWCSLIFTGFFALIYALRDYDAETIPANINSDREFDEEVDEHRRQFSYRGMGYPFSNINDLDD